MKCKIIIVIFCGICLLSIQGLKAAQTIATFTVSCRIPVIVETTDEGELPEENEEEETAIVKNLQKQIITEEVVRDGKKILLKTVVAK